MNYGIFHSRYENLARRSDNNFPWVQQYRTKSWDKFISMGLPDRKWENWRYISLRPLKDFIARISESDASYSRFHPEKKLIDSKIMELKKSFKLSSFLETENFSYFPICGVNGFFETSPKVPENFSVRHLKDLTENPFSQFEQKAGTHDKTTSISLNNPAGNVDENPFFYLNSALMSDALVIHVQRPRQQDDRPLLLHLIHGVEPELGEAIFPRIALILEEGVQISLVESYLPMVSDKEYFCAPVMQICLKEKSILNHLRIQNDNDLGIHLASTEKILLSHSYLESLSVSTSGKLVRHDLGIKLAEENAQVEFNGLFLIKDNQVIDHHTCVDHIVPMTKSRQLYHGMVDSGGKGIFNGKVCVRPGAHGTDAKQTNKNLLLSSDGEINTKPELQIEADDVKCSHGAAIGQVDPIQLHYLRSRGIPEDEAKKMLLSAFASDVIERFPIDSRQLKSWLQNQVGEYFR
jgi:Fe-S cluster assembly protein SufD